MVSRAAIEPSLSKMWKTFRTRSDRMKNIFQKKYYRYISSLIITGLVLAGLLLRDQRFVQYIVYFVIIETLLVPAKNKTEWIISQSKYRYITASCLVGLIAIGFVLHSLPIRISVILIVLYLNVNFYWIRQRRYGKLV